MTIRLVWSILQVLALLPLATPARADWATVGAAYQCTKSKFALYGTVESSGGNIPAPPGTRALKAGDNLLSCNVGGAPIVARIAISAPGSNGACGGRGTIGIWKMQVGKTEVVEFGEQMLYCHGEPTIISIDVAGTSQDLAVNICRGVWDWESSYRNVQCEKKWFTHDGATSGVPKPPNMAVEQTAFGVRAPLR